MTSRTYRPAIELVPEPLWGKNLRALLSASEWKKLRKRLLDERGPRCAICGFAEEVKKIHAHEEWAYDTSSSPAVARVIGVELVCAKCHAVEHFGRLRLLYKNGQIEERVLHDVIAHFCRINGATVDDFLAHEDEQVAAWKKRNAIATWVVEAKPYA